MNKFLKHSFKCILIGVQLGVSSILLESSSVILFLIGVLGLILGLLLFCSILLSIYED
jgi:hypothetical protein